MKIDIESEGLPHNTVVKIDGKQLRYVQEVSWRQNLNGPGELTIKAFAIKGETSIKMNEKEVNFEIVPHLQTNATWLDRIKHYILKRLLRGYYLKLEGPALTSL